jgi:nitroimidazol reductase NimA-like FMN-containing flavoprotein (pyridoxamine 5'-phosphate oxidase superfamily)
MSDNVRIEQLPEQDCWAMLDRVRFGRLAMAPMGDPDIFPINFLVAGSTLLMRTGAGTKLADIVVNSAVAVESDGIDGDVAWSVIAKGRARMVSSFTEIYAMDEKHLESWLPTEKPIYVEISVESISGRRFFRGSAV